MQSMFASKKLDQWIMQFKSFHWLSHHMVYEPLYRALQICKEKRRQAARTPKVVSVVASHYQSLQIGGFALTSMFFR